MAELRLSVEDAQAIMPGCLIKWRDRYMYVIDVDGEGTQRLMDIETQEIVINSEGFDDYRAVNDMLGFVNLAGQCAYISRTSQKVFRFSLHSRNMVVADSIGDYTNLYESVVQSIRNLQNKAICNTFRKQFPTLKEAIRSIQEGIAQAVAFDRQFAISSAYKVYYKDEGIVGKIKDGNIIFNSGREYLANCICKEQLK